MASFERIGSEEVWRGQDREGARRHASATRTARRPSARSSTHPGAVVIVAHDGERVYLVRQPREAVGEQALLELPAGKLDEEGEEPARHGQARAGRGDRQGRARAGST